MIKFFNETDIIYEHYVDKIKNKNINFNFENEDEINIVLEYFNIIKYYKNNEIKGWLDLETDLQFAKVIEYMESQLKEFIRNKNKRILSFYNSVKIEYLKDF